MPGIPEELAEALPSGTEDAFEEHYPERPGSVELLRGLIERHLEEVEKATAGEHMVDAHLARVIADRLLNSMQSWEILSESEKAAVHGTVHYFVLNDDATGDLSSAVGFEDDARVVNACMAYLGRPDLTIDLE